MNKYRVFTFFAGVHYISDVTGEGMQNINGALEIFQEDCSVAMWAPGTWLQIYLLDDEHDQPLAVSSVQ